MLKWKQSDGSPKSIGLEIVIITRKGLEQILFAGKHEFEALWVALVSDKIESFSPMILPRGLMLITYREKGSSDVKCWVGGYHQYCEKRHQEMDGEIGILTIDYGMGKEIPDPRTN